MMNDPPARLRDVSANELSAKPKANRDRRKAPPCAWQDNLVEKSDRRRHSRQRTHFKSTVVRYGAIFSGRPAMARALPAGIPSIEETGYTRESCLRDVEAGM
jgi:hypothetical protein